MNSSAEVAKTIRTLRENVRPVLKQEEMAFALNMTQSNYSKLEKGKRKISLDQLEIIAGKLNTTSLQILLLSDSHKKKEFNLFKLKEALISTLLVSEGVISPMKYSNEEMNTVIEIVKDFFTKSNQ